MAKFETCLGKGSAGIGYMKRKEKEKAWRLYQVLAESWLCWK